MPRPSSLRRTVSTPVLRARAMSNPYPLPSVLSDAHMHVPPPLSIPVRSSLSRTRRVASWSSPSSSEFQSQTQSRRVLADITWWYDGQIDAVAEDSGNADEEDEILSPISQTSFDTPRELQSFGLEDMERLSLGASNGTLVEEDEVENSGADMLLGASDRLLPTCPATPELTPCSLLPLLDSPASLASSTLSTPERPVIARSISLGNEFSKDLDFTSQLAKHHRHGRRESSFSSTFTDFEDTVPMLEYA